MSESREQQIQSPDEKDNSSNQRNQPPNPVPPTKTSDEPRPPAELPHSITNSQNTKTDKPNWCEKWTLGLEVAGVLGLVFYCWVNWREWQTFDSERKTMESEFRAEQINAERQINEIQSERNLGERPWINPYQITRMSDDNFSNSFYIVLCMKNIGKTPAPNLFTGLETATNLAEVHDIAPIVPTNFTTGFLFPDTESKVASRVMPISILSDALNGGYSFYIYGHYCPV